MDKLQKYITKCENDYCILMPVFYELNIKPSWRVVFIGTKAECENAFSNYPNTMNADANENTTNKINAIKEYLFIKERLKNTKALERFFSDIKPIYHNIFKKGDF